MKSSMRSWRVVNFVLSPISGHLSAESKALLINSQADPLQCDATGRAAAEAFSSWWSKTRRIERRHVVRREFKIRSPSETFHLRDAGGACDRRSDALARHEPSQRDLRRFGLMPGRNFIERLENIQTAF